MATAEAMAPALLDFPHHRAGTEKACRVIHLDWLYSPLPTNISLELVAWQYLTIHLTPTIKSQIKCCVSIDLTAYWRPTLRGLKSQHY